MCSGKGIVEVKESSFVKKLFCKHSNTIEGLDCSSIGLMRISGEDRYLVCEDCGKILKELHTTY